MSRATVLTRSAHSVLAEKMQLAESCLCTSPARRKQYTESRNQGGVTGDRDVRHYPPAMRPDTLAQFEALLVAPSPRQRRAAATAAAAEALAASPRPALATAAELRRLPLRPGDCFSRGRARGRAQR